MTTMATARTAAKPISPSPSSFSPASSASTTPSTASPTSPRSSQTLSQNPHPATRQIRPPKSPMYIPAALRPTAPHHRARPSNPPTPPQSSPSSGESITSRPTTPSARPTITTSLSMTSKNNTGLSTTPSSPTSMISPAAGSHPHPTRSHWKPDAEAPVCDAFGCNTSFSLLNRRHHCRRCGGVFCALDSNSHVPLNNAAEFDPEGGWWRACQVCEKKFQEKAAAGFDLRDGSDGEGTGSKAIGMKVTGAERPGQAAASVPKDWNWSTF